MRTISVAALLLLGAAIGPALAGNGDRGPAASESTKPRIDTDTDNIFGFGEGTDTPQKGERELSLDTFTRFNKRRIFGPSAPAGAVVPEAGEGVIADSAEVAADPGRPRYRVFTGKLAAQYAVTDDFAVELGIFGHARSVRNLGGTPRKSFAAFDGGSIEFKYRLLERSADNPIGLAIIVQPRYARIEESSGRGVDAFQAEAGLLLDARIIPDKLWFATNVGYEPEVSRLRGSRSVERASAFTWSNALTWRLGDNSFAGGEVRYVAAYSGTFLNRFEADAIYIGPHLNHKPTDSSFVSFAVSFRVTGSEPVLSAGESSAATFPHTLLRVKIGMEF